MVDQAAAAKAENVRVCIMNPSWILGPQLQPGDITGNGLPWFAKITRGESMNEQGSSSIIVFISYNFIEPATLRDTYKDKIETFLCSLELRICDPRFPTTR